MLDDIILFVKLVNSGRFSYLARILGVSQSTISRRIENLEKCLEVKLIKRDSHYVELTDKGKLLYANFKDFESSSNSFLQHFFSTSDQVVGKLKILLSSYLANYAITSKLVEFSNKHKQLAITAIYDYQDLYTSQQDYDIVITPFISEEILPENISHIYSDRIIAVCSKEYYQRYGIPDSFECLNEHMVVGKLVYGQPEIDIFPAYKITTGEVLTVKNPVNLKVNSFIESKIMVETHCIISGLPEESVKQELLSGELINVFPDYHFGLIDYYVIRNIEIDDPRFIAFNQFLNECINRLKDEK